MPPAVAAPNPPSEPAIPAPPRPGRPRKQAPKTAEAGYHLVGTTCEHCKRPFSRRVKTGLFITCTHCGFLQHGPDFKTAQARRDEKRKRRAAIQKSYRERRDRELEASALEPPSSNGHHPEAAPELRPTPSSPAPVTPLPAPALEGAPSPRRSGLRRLLSGEWEER